LKKKVNSSNHQLTKTQIEYISKNYDRDIVKINNIFVSNVNGVSAATITISYNNAAAGAGTNFRMAYQISVPANTTLMILDKSGAIYLTENTSLVAQAGTAGYLEVVTSYEIIS
jgi:hypothetical protein